MTPAAPACRANVRTSKRHLPDVRSDSRRARKRQQTVHRPHLARLANAVGDGRAAHAGFDIAASGHFIAGEDVDIGTAVARTHRDGAEAFIAGQVEQEGTVI